MSKHTWQEILDHIPDDDTGPIDAPTEAICLYPLSDMGIIGVSGEDAQSFLQNLLSNDVKALDQSHSHLSAVCSAKGRVISLFRVLAEKERYLLILPMERVESSMKRLQMFKLMSKVDIADLSADMLTLGVSGANAQTVLQAKGLPVTEAVNGVCQDNGLLSIHVPGLIPRYLFLIPADRARQVWDAVNDAAVVLPGSAWRNQDLLAGQPRVLNDTVEEFVPQMINLHSINGVSFNKGCYPGQEVVARMHYLGKLKRYMFLGSVSADRAPKAGQEVYLRDNPQAVGKIVDAAPVGDSTWNLLLVLQTSSLGQGELLLENQSEWVINLKELPYEVEVERS